MKDQKVKMTQDSKIKARAGRRGYTDTERDIKGEPLAGPEVREVRVSNHTVLPSTHEGKRLWAPSSGPHENNNNNKKKP